MKYNLDRKNKERIDNLEKKKKVLTTWPYDKDGNLMPNVSVTGVNNG